MARNKQTALVLGMALLMIGMAFATTFGGADDGLAPTVTKTVDPDFIWFGSTETTSTVTIEVTGDDGTTGTTITPIDVVFAIDSSGSMTWNDPGGDRLDAAAGFLANLDDSRDTAGVVSWDSDVDFAFGLSSDFDDTDGVEYHIYQVDSSGGTNLNAGLAESVDMLDNTGQSGSIKVIIFLTDGQGTYTYYGGGGPVDDAVDNGYIIFSIGLGGAASGPLEDMADETGGTYYSSASADNLDDIYATIFEEVTSFIALYDVDVVEMVEDYFTVVYSSISPTPDYFNVAVDGITTIKWYNVGQYAGNFDSALKSDETATLSFDVKATKAGFELPVQVLPGAYVTWDDIDGNSAGTTAIPQAYISVGYSATFIADGGSDETATDVGEVFMWQDDDYLYVKFTTTGDWEMTLTHLHVAEDASDIPQTKKGNPKVGQFDYQTTHDPAVQTFTYMIDWDASWGDTLYIAAHANVQMVTGYDEYGDPIYRTETAWGDGMDFDGNSWATYMKYVDP